MWRLRVNQRKGYILLGLVLLFSVLALSSTVGIFEQDTRLKRFQEGEFKTNLDTIRRAIDLYRFKYSVTAPDDAKLRALEGILKTGPASDVIQLLAQESFLRGRIASGTMRWRRSQNLVLNSSFEIDEGTTDPNMYKAGGWRGNFTPNDLVPDGWELTNTGAFQQIALSGSAGPATFVVSFWARCASPTAGVKLKLGPAAGFPTLQLTANRPDWKRYYGVYAGSIPDVVKLELELDSSTSGETALVDGVMLEEWVPPANAPPSLTPVPSAWVASFAIVPDIASKSLQHQLLEDLISPDATPASMSWWLEW